MSMMLSVQKFITIVFIFLSLNLQAQKEILKCQSISSSYQLELYKICSKEEISIYPAEHPLFLIDSVNFEVIKNTLMLVNARQNEMMELQKILSNYENLLAEKDSLLKKQEKRVILYKNSFDQMSDISHDMSEQVDAMYYLSKKEYRKNSLKKFCYGGLAGLISGFALALLLD